AGVLAYSNCVNPTNGGTISAAQNICINATPSPFTSSAAASGNSGTLEYKWQSSTTSASSGFSDISGATSAAYTPGSAISQTTWYKRLARVSCMSDWTGAAESNVLTVAVDQSNAAATTYNSSWASSQDDGTTGLNSWVLITSGTSGHFTGSSDINVSGRSWAMYASSSGQANAIRPFTSSMSVGSTLRFSIDNGFVQTGGTIGFSLRNSSSQNLMEFYFSGGQSNYTISDNAGASATTIPYSTSGFNIAITYTAANTYSMSVTPAAGGTTVYFTGRTFSATGGSQVPKEIRFFNANAGSGSSYDYFINSISLNRPAIGGETNFAAQTVCSSAGAATLSVAGYSGSSYQWYRNTSATTSGASTVGTNSASYTPTDIGTTYYYYCVVSGTCANAQSNFSGAVLINQSPTITLTNNTTSVCSGPATVNYAYSATLGSPNQYSIDWDATANTDGLSDVTNATLPLSQISVSVPSVDVYKVYTGTLTVRNSTTGCVSGTYALTLTVNGIPTISLNAIADICQGTTTASLGYSTGSSTHYTIDFNAAANTAGFTDIGTATVLPATPSGSISISVPGGVAAGTYSATLTPSNNGTGCTGTGYSISITVNPTTNITVETNFGAQTLCSAESASALSVTATGVGLSYQWYQNTSASTVGATPVGTNSDTYTPPSTVGTYYYYCVVSGTCSNDQSSFSGAITFNTTPTITLTSNTASTCSGPANVNFAYSATTGTPNQYSIDFNGAANTAGFSDVTNASLTGTPIVVSVPGAGTGVYNGTLTVRNSTTGCVSGTYSISITINGNPSISLGSDPVVCFGTTSTTLSYSTGSSDEYKIDYDGAANSAGFTDVSYTSLPGSPLTLTIPGGAAAAVYNATLTVRNSGTGCESAGYPVTLTVTAIPTITSAGHNSRCGTGTVQLGAVASAGTINWYTASSGGSSINTGINYTTPSISSTTTYYVDATINGCTTGSRTAVTATVNTVNTWDGTTGDWNDGTKWSCGSAPDGSTNVVIPGGTVTLNTLFEVPSGKTLTLTGGSLIIDPGVQLIVTGTADFGGRPVTIRSTSSGNGSIGIIGNNGSNLTGATSVTVERYIPGRRAWRGLSVPLKTSSGSQSIYSQWQNGGSVIANTGVLLWNPSGTGGFNQNSTSGAGTNLRSYGVSAFSTPTSTTSAVLFNTSGPVPYLVFVTDQHRSGANVGNMVTGFGNTTLKATGVLYTGNYTKSGLASGIHMIPNPYPSQLEFTGATRTNVNNKFWVWDPLLGGSYTGGGYQSYSNGVFAPGGASYSGISGTNTQIAAGGAFWIESTGSGEISFDEVDKTTGNLRPFRLGSQTEILNINMTNIEGDIMYDGVAAAYNNEASVNNDAMDTKKFSLGTENISIVRFNEHYSIEFRPLIDSKDTIYLRLHKMQQKRYQLVLAAQNFSLENGLIATLQDLYLNQEMPLSLSGKSEYSFEVGENVASAENRFRIVFRTSAITPVREITSLKNVSMYPNPISKSGTIQIDFKNQIPGRYTLKVFNVLGVQVHNDFVVHNGGSFIHKLVLPGSLKAGSYIAEILSEKGERKQFKLTIY
ncbi:MAG: beta strand repeat-containing protein, partial [Lacibacter sp.]